LIEKIKIKTFNRKTIENLMKYQLNRGQKKNEKNSITKKRVKNYKKIDEKSR